MITRLHLYTLPPPNLFSGVFSETIGREGDFFLSDKITYSDR
jgi:hypothetical protein